MDTVGYLLITIVGVGFLFLEKLKMLFYTLLIIIGVTYLLLQSCHFEALALLLTSGLLEIYQVANPPSFSIISNEKSKGLFLVTLMLTLIVLLFYFGVEYKINFQYKEVASMKHKLIWSPGLLIIVVYIFFLNIKERRNR